MTNLVPKEPTRDVLPYPRAAVLDGELEIEHPPFVAKGAKRGYPISGISLASSNWLEASDNFSQGP